MHRRVAQHTYQLGTPVREKPPRSTLPPPPPAAAVVEERVRGSESEGRMERGGQDDGDGDDRAGRNGRGKIGAEGRYRGSGKNEKKTMGNVEPSWGAACVRRFRDNLEKEKKEIEER